MILMHCFKKKGYFRDVGKWFLFYFFETSFPSISLQHVVMMCFAIRYPIEKGNIINKSYYSIQVIHIMELQKY